MWGSIIGVTKRDATSLDQSSYSSVPYSQEANFSAKDDHGCRKDDGGQPAVVHAPGKW